MRIEPLAVLFPILAIASCGYESDSGTNMGTEQWQQQLLSAKGTSGTGPDPLAFDITQRTCALYVALRSHAFDETPAFGRDIDADMIHWNMCTGGTMVACATVTAKDGDPVQVGIPWPYAQPQQY